MVKSFDEHHTSIVKLTSDLSPMLSVSIRSSYNGLDESGVNYDATTSVGEEQ